MTNLIKICSRKFIDLEHWSLGAPSIKITDLIICLLVRLSVCRFGCLVVCLQSSFSPCVLAFLSLHLSTSLFLCVLGPSVCLLACWFVWLFVRAVCMSVCRFLVIILTGVCMSLAHVDPEFTKYIKNLYDPCSSGSRISKKDKGLICFLLIGIQHFKNT